MREKRQDHPLFTSVEQIEEQGLMFFDDVQGMPAYNEPFTTPYMVIVLNMQGWVKAECDMRPVHFKPHDIAILPPRHILYARESSSDYRAMLIVMSVSFQTERKHGSTDIFRDNFHYLQQPDIHLNDEQYDVMVNLFKMIKTASGTTSPRRWDMLGHLLDVLFLFLQDYRRENGIRNHRVTSNELLFNQFYQSITEHYRESREVRFYAQQFHLSPKYFASLIKQHTNVKALDWINGYVLLQTKILLYQQQLTVQEIAHRLGFSDQASLSRFFKQNTGLTPTQYREII